MIYNVRFADIREYNFIISSKLYEEDICKIINLFNESFDERKKWELVSVVNDNDFHNRCGTIRTLNEIFTIFEFFNIYYFLGKYQFERIMEEYRITIKTKSEIDRWKEIKKSPP